MSGRQVTCTCALFALATALRNNASSQLALRSDPDEEKESVEDAVGKDSVITGIVITDDCHVWTAGYDGYVNEWGCELDPEKSYATTKKLSSFEHGDSPTPVRALIEIGGLIISAGMDGKVVSYNRETKDKLRLDVDTGSIVQALAADQQTLYIGGYDGVVHGYDVDQGYVARCRKYGNGTVNALVFPTGGDLLYVGGTDGAIDVWYADSKEWTHLEPGDLCPFGIKNETVPNAEEIIKAVEQGPEDAPPGDTVRQVGPVINAFVSSGNGRSLYSGSTDGVIRAWDTETGENIGWLTLPSMDNVNALAVTKDGHTVYCGGDNVAWSWYITTYSVNNRTSGYWINGKHGPLYSYGGKIKAVAIDEKKDRLYLGGNSGEALAFDAKNGTFLYRMWHKSIDWDSENPLANKLEAPAKEEGEADAEALIQVHQKNIRSAG